MAKALTAFLSMTEVWIGALGLAAFLALFWVLRGAPVGQSVRPEDDEDAPQSGYRDRVVAAVCVGMLLICVGAYVAVTRSVPWSIPAFVLGFGTVLGLVLINQRYRHGSPTLRRTVDLSTASLNASLFAGILIVVNVIAFRYGGRAIDMTQEQAFSLSSLTVTQLKTLQKPVTFTTFYGRSAVATQQLDRVQQLLELFKAANPDKVKLDHVDPFRDLGRYDDMVKRVPDVEMTQGGGVVIEYGEGTGADRVVVRNADLFEIPRTPRFNPDAERFESVFKGEDSLLTALIRLREAVKAKIVFTTGHGEPSIDDTDSSRPGLGIWKARLLATGSEVFSVNLLNQEIPADAAVVVIVGPKTPFKPEEVNRLKAFSDAKKPVLAVLGDAGPNGLDGYLRGFGIEIGAGTVVEPKNNVRGRAEAVVVTIVNPRDPILEPLKNESLLLPRPSPLKIAGAAGDPKAPESAKTARTVLLKTTPQSWVEHDQVVKKDGNDESGPITIGVAVNDVPAKGETQLGPARMVVISSRYAGDTAIIQFAPTNLDLLMNSVNWLRGRPELKGIAPAKTHVSMTLTADPSVRARLILVPTVMAVLLIITLGVTTYLARRA